jgi:hypothetical protein
MCEDSDDGRERLHMCLPSSYALSLIFLLGTRLDKQEWSPSQNYYIYSLHFCHQAQPLFGCHVFFFFCLFTLELNAASTALVKEATSLMRPRLTEMS